MKEERPVSLGGVIHKELRKAMSMFCVMVFVLSAVLSGIGTDVSADARNSLDRTKTDLVVLEGESLVGPEQQIGMIEASGGAACMASTSLTKNFYSNVNQILNSGTYKMYIRAKSETCSVMEVGADKITTPNANLIVEKFTLTEDFRWYATNDFVVTTDLDTIDFWAHSYTTGKYSLHLIDKVMLVRWKDGAGVETSSKMGQITDQQQLDSFGVPVPTNQEDSDFDGILDDSEFLQNVWWFEAEHFESPLTDAGGNPYVVETDDTEASNSKAIKPTAASYSLSMVDFLDAPLFPNFKSGTQYKFYLRARGTFNAQMDLIVQKDSLNQYVTKTYYMTEDYRWFSTPVFAITGNPNDAIGLELQVQTPPPGDGMVYLDKLMVMRVHDGTNPTGILPGRVSDPIDPDTDFDGRSDFNELSDMKFSFEAEDCIPNPVWNQNYDAGVQIKTDVDASNYKCIANIVYPSVQPLILDVTSIVATYITDYMTNYQLYVRAKTTQPGLGDKLSIAYGATNEDYVLTGDYRWYHSFELSLYQALSLTIYASTVPAQYQDVRLDKFFIARVNPSDEGQYSDIMDPDMDWDGISDGVEVEDDTYWFEAEDHSVAPIIQKIPGVSGGGTNPDSSNSWTICSVQVGSEYQFINNIYPNPNTFPALVPGEEGDYQIHIRARVAIEGFGVPGEALCIDVVNAVGGAYTQSYMIDAEYQWYSTGIFTLATGRIDFKLYSLTYGILVDKLMLIKMDNSKKITTDVLDRDMDWDHLDDSREYDDDLWIFEAEDYPHIDSAPPGHVVDDMLAGSAKALHRTAPGYFYSKYIEVPAGTYKYTFRAKEITGTTEFAQVNLRVNSGSDNIQEEYELAYMQFTAFEYRWQTPIQFVVTQPTYVELTANFLYGNPCDVYIDKFILARIKDEKSIATGMTFGKVNLDEHITTIHAGAVFRHAYLTLLAQPGKISDPFVLDSDGDTLSDSYEIALNPGAANLYITDPLNVDSDRDNIWDSIEIAKPAHPTTGYVLDPTLADSDGDHLPDGWVDGWCYDPEQKKFGIDRSGKNRMIDLGDTLGTEIRYLEGEDINWNGFLDTGTSGEFAETDPLNMDTDLDLIPDYKEYILQDSDLPGVGMNPLDIDSDDDGISDTYEYQNLDPMDDDNDYDEDKILDGVELGVTLTSGYTFSVPATGADQIDVTGDSQWDVRGTDTGSSNFVQDVDPTKTTNPTRTDSDADGLPDGWVDLDNDNTMDVGEFEDRNFNGNREGQTPASPSDWNSGAGPGETDATNSDTDNDDGAQQWYCALDGPELMYRTGTYPHGTDPLNPSQFPGADVDTDDDGLTDYYEDNHHYITSSLIDWTGSDDLVEDYTDKNNEDTDSDGLTDYEENRAGTNPLHPDTDQDGILDSWEGGGDGFNGDTEWKESYYAGGAICAKNYDSDDDGQSDRHEARVTFRTNVADGAYHKADTSLWIVLRLNGELKAFGRVSGLKTPGGDTQIGTTPTSYDDGTATNYPIYEYYSSGKQRIYIDTTQSGEGIYEEDAATDPQMREYPLNTYIYDPDYMLSMQGIEWYTDPIDPDSDDDGLTDGEEIWDYYTDPNDDDTDGDLLDDYEEVITYCTDPLVDADEDGDKWTDSEEIRIYGTKHDDADTDEDGLPDKWEWDAAHRWGQTAVAWCNPLLTYSNGYHHDGGVELDWCYDSTTSVYSWEDDDLTLYEEWLYKTDPNNDDSDGDGQDDGTEITYGTDPNDATSKSDDVDGDGIINQEDTDDDNDGLLDTEEEGYGSDQLKVDSDGDGLDDDDEIDWGWDPAHYDPIIPMVGQSVFDSGCPRDTGYFMSDVAGHSVPVREVQIDEGTTEKLVFKIRLPSECHWSNLGDFDDVHMSMVFAVDTYYWEEEYADDPWNENHEYNWVSEMDYQVMDLGNSDIIISNDCFPVEHKIVDVPYLHLPLGKLSPGRTYKLTIDNVREHNIIFKSQVQWDCGEPSAMKPWYNLPAIRPTLYTERTPEQNTDSVNLDTSIGYLGATVVNKIDMDYSNDANFIVIARPSLRNALTGAETTYVGEKYDAGWSTTKLRTIHSTYKQLFMRDALVDGKEFEVMMSYRNRQGGTVTQTGGWGNEYATWTYLNSFYCMVNGEGRTLKSDEKVEYSVKNEEDEEDWEVRASNHHLNGVGGDLGGVLGLGLGAAAVVCGLMGPAMWIPAVALGVASLVCTIISMTREDKTHFNSGTKEIDDTEDFPSMPQIEDDSTYDIRGYTALRNKCDWNWGETSNTYGDGLAKIGSVLYVVNVDKHLTTPMDYSTLSLGMMMMNLAHSKTDVGIIAKGQDHQHVWKPSWDIDVPIYRQEN